MSKTICCCSSLLPTTMSHHTEMPHYCILLDKRWAEREWWRKKNVGKFASLFKERSTSWWQKECWELDETLNVGGGRGECLHQRTIKATRRRVAKIHDWSWTNSRRGDPWTREILLNQRRYVLRDTRHDSPPHFCCFCFRRAVWTIHFSPFHIAILVGWGCSLKGLQRIW